MQRLSRSAPLVAAFLAAIVLANLAVAAFGQVALVFTAWVLIPFDMLTRDVLHERWRGSNLIARMAGLILLGGAITLLANVGAWRVALASFAAFACAMVVNGLVFDAMFEKHSRFVRMNTSNLAAAVLDSIVFPLVAFGALDTALSIAQAGSKFLGGVVWSGALILIVRLKK